MDPSANMWANGKPNFSSLLGNGYRIFQRKTRKVNSQFPVPREARKSLTQSVEAATRGNLSSKKITELLIRTTQSAMDYRAQESSEDTRLKSFYDNSRSGISNKFDLLLHSFYSC